VFGIARLFRGMGGKDHLLPAHPLVSEMVKCGKGMAFVQVVHIGTAQGFHDFGTPYTQDNTLRYTGMQVVVVQVVGNRSG